MATFKVKITISPAISTLYAKIAGEHPFLLATCLLFSGCASITYQVQSEKPVLLSSNLDRDHEIIKRVDDKAKRLWMFWWFIPSGKDRGRTLENYVGTGDAIKNVTIHEYYDFIDWLIQNWSSFIIGIPGITNTFNENFQADVVEYKGDE